MTRIFIDADACPVKKEVFEVSIRNNLDVFVVSNGGIRPNPNPLIKSIFVDESRPETYPLNDMAVDQAPLSNFFKIVTFQDFLALL